MLTPRSHPPSTICGIDTTDWPRLPIQPEDLPKIRELLTAEEYEKMFKRIEVSGRLNSRRGKPPVTPTDLAASVWQEEDFYEGVR